MKLRILGCGTSSGVPRIGNDWGACDPAEPRNRRSRASIVVESATTRLLVDTSPDMRQQLLGADLIDIDAILWTHDHADHCHGIDDARQLFHARGAPIPGYAFAETIAFTDYVALNGEAGARDAGKLRSEGKDYVVQDGDVLLFRFNV